MVVAHPTHSSRQVTDGPYEGMTALMFAAQKGSLELCQFLVANKAEVNAKARWCGDGRGQGAVGER